MALLHYLNERKEPIPREHTKMTKFRDTNDDLYKSVRERLKDMAADGLEAREHTEVCSIFRGYSDTHQPLDR